jgi:hypothetical protein
VLDLWVFAIPIILNHVCVLVTAAFALTPGRAGQREGWKLTDGPLRWTIFIEEDDAQYGLGLGDIS